MSAHKQMELPLKAAAPSDETDNSSLKRSMVAINKATSDRIEDSLKRMYARCESPIEKKMLEALVQAGLDIADTLAVKWRLRADGKSLDSIAIPMPYSARKKRTGLVVYPQAPVHLADGRRCRLDFEVLYYHGCASPKDHVRLVVECDGHKYHYETRAQVQRDRRRDRMLTRDFEGVLRFTGSELNHKPASVLANEVCDLIVAKLKRMEITDGSQGEMLHRHNHQAGRDQR